MRRFWLDLPASCQCRWGELFHHATPSQIESGGLVIENAECDLKAVNPNRAVNKDRRTTGASA